jgi:hypothetical protein
MPLQLITTAALTETDLRPLSQELMEPQPKLQLPPRRLRLPPQIHQKAPQSLGERQDTQGTRLQFEVSDAALVCCYPKEIGRKRKTLKYYLTAQTALTNDANQPKLYIRGRRHI